MDGSRAVTATIRLRLALEGAAEALAHAQVEGLLASEGALEFALADLPPMHGLADSQRDAVRRELEAAERALLRCRRLGSTLSDYVRLTLASHGANDPSSDYSQAVSGLRSGRALRLRSGHAGLDARV